MAIIIENIPNASTLINSMRSIGYDFESAVADIIDNSISAFAKNIEISFPTDGYSNIYLHIIDDGNGMSKEELFEAMRFGSVKDEERSKEDLGRFGLGLKTASISQCKKITVISKKENEVSGYSWDLDLLVGEKKWNIIELTKSEILEKMDILNTNLITNNFTIVIWENFDTLEKDITPFKNIYDVFFDRINQMEKHISLVFHRIIDDGLVIKINNNVVNSLDPFLSKHNKTSIKPEQVINTKTKDNNDEKVKMQVYVLPYFKDLNPADIEKLGGRENLNKQGFYIYRNKRLIIHNTWFRINPKSELSNNARIRIDIPNTLDNLWSIDIKKQNAVIPSSLLSQLRMEVSDAAGKSKKLYKYKGDQQTKDGSIWNKVIDERNKTIYYKINFESELLKSLYDDLNEKDQANVKKIINLIELSLPYRDIYNSVAEKKDINSINVQKENELLIEAYNLFHTLKKIKNLNDNQIIDSICSLEPYLSANIREKLENKIYGL